MNFDPPIIKSYPGNISIPLYMTYSDFRKSDSDVLEDLSYLEQIYPQRVNKYIDKITSVLDKLDYEGSMIYDEYPDCYSMRSLADSVYEIIMREIVNEELTDTEKVGLKDLVRVLTCNELYKRRRANKYSFPKF